METAVSQLQLRTRELVRMFLGELMIEQFVYRSTKPWENYPEAGYVDAYHFSDGLLLLYLSFGRSPKAERKWIVKSLKKR